MLPVNSKSQPNNMVRLTSFNKDARMDKNIINDAIKHSSPNLIIAT